MNEPILIQTLPIDGDDFDERRLFNSKGEMVQIINRTNEVFRHLAYWDLQPGNEERGHHFHTNKDEHLYVLKGEVEVVIEDPRAGSPATYLVTAGQRVTIRAGVPHAYRAKAYCQVLEYGSNPYDASDTTPHRLAL